MTTPRPTKRKPKHITASSITLVDALGKPRIFMDAGDGNCPASICIFGKEERSIQLQASADGALSIALLGSHFGASLAVSPENDAGLSIRDRDGRLGAMLGSVYEQGKHQLVLFQNGQPVWSSAKPGKAKRGKSKPSAK
ncbi:MAG: hypothetical protein J0L73_10250 [Verrucomicrobia bacterium]|nr:hypothetical protein [Verrucomicrobiota bacterium]